MPEHQLAPRGTNQLANQQSSALERRLLAINDLLAATADAMGCDLSGGLDVMISDLARQELSIEQIASALARCRMEMRGSNGYPPRLTLPDILDRAGIVYGPKATELEAVTAWDRVIGIAKLHGRKVDGRWVLRPLATLDKKCRKCEGMGMVVTVKGNGVREAGECSCRKNMQVPLLSARIEDAVRRVGGWDAICELQPSAFPFVRRDFQAEFMRWQGVEDHRPMLPPGESVDGLSRPSRGLLESLIPPENP